MWSAKTSRQFNQLAEEWQSVRLDQSRKTSLSLLASRWLAAVIASTSKIKGSERTIMAPGLERFRRTFSQTFATGPSVKLRIENQNGPISVQGNAADEVVVNVVAELWAESPEDADLELQRIQCAFTFVDGTVNLRTPELLKPSGGLLGWSWARGPKVDIEVSVPRGTSVEVESRNSKVDIRSLRGPVQVDAQGGSVALNQITEDVAVKGRNGSIKVNGIDSSASLTSKNGSITAEQVGGAVSAEAANGSIDIISPGGAVQADSRNGSVRFRGQVLAVVQITTRNGSIRFGVPKDIRFELDANSVRGTVKSDLTVRKSGATSAPRPLVQLRSENGSIRIEEIAGEAQSARAAEPETPRNQKSS